MATFDDITQQVEEQTRELTESTRGLAALYRDVQAEAVADAYRDLVETSPGPEKTATATGAYRSEHVIEEGDGVTLLYESPNRVGPDAIVKPPTFIDPPIITGRAPSIHDFATVQIANRRFYAAALEYGSGTTQPRYIYQDAGLRAEQNVERIVARANQRKLGL